jgi:O-antigen biosynthesis protein
MGFSGEQFVPEMHGNIALEHIHRYLLACEITEGKSVLDIACGEGYGSFMLSERATRVTGIDISVEAVEHAQVKYRKSNLNYVAGDCARIPLADNSVDIVISFETIEHHAQHGAMMGEVKRVLRPDGILLISSPDRVRYSLETGYSNPFHVKELFASEFKDLIAEYFRNTVFLGQRIIYGSVIATNDRWIRTKFYREQDGEPELMPGIRPIYWVALASDVDLPEIAAGVYEQPIDVSETVTELRTSINEVLNTIDERDQEIASHLGAAASPKEELAIL